MPEEPSFLVPKPESSLPAPFLFSEEAMEKLEGLEVMAMRRGEWTGERLRKEAPRLVEAVLRLSALDVTQEEIAYALQVSVNSVAKIQVDCDTAVEGYKERLGGKLRKLTRLTAGALTEKLEDPEEREKMKVGELAVVLGITIEKEQLVSGGATQRIEHTVTAPPIDAFNEYIASLPSANATGMDCEAGEISPKGAIEAESERLPAAALGEPDSAQADPLKSAANQPPADMESAAIPEESASRDPAFDPAEPPKEDPAP